MPNYYLPLDDQPEPIVQFGLTPMALPSREVIKRVREAWDTFCWQLDEALTGRR